MGVSRCGGDVVGSVADFFGGGVWGIGKYANTGATANARNANAKCLENGASDGRSVDNYLMEETVKQNFNAECKARILEQFPNVLKARPIWHMDGTLTVLIEIPGSTWYYNANRQTFDKVKT